MSHKLPLSKPIKAHDQEISELTFRDLTGEDLIEVGAAPFIIDDRSRTHIDFAATAAYIVRLAGIPTSSVKQMAPADMMKAFGVIAGFFGGTEALTLTTS